MENTTLPHWDLSTVYPSLDSPEFEDGFAHLTAQINALAELFDERKIERVENAVTDSKTVMTFDTVMNQITEERVNTRSRRYLRDLRRDAVIEFR